MTAAAASCHRCGSTDLQPSGRCRACARRYAEASRGVRGPMVGGRRELLKRADAYLATVGMTPPPQAQATPATTKRYGVGDVRDEFARLLGGEATPPAPPPAQQRPTGRALDPRAPLWRSLDGADLGSHVLVYAEGEPTRLVSRTELLAWAQKHARVLAAEIEALRTRDGWIVTIKLAQSGHIVGALRVVRPPP